MPMPVVALAWPAAVMTMKPAAAIEATAARIFFIFNPSRMYRAAFR
jgi:hypothetical protein